MKPNLRKEKRNILIVDDHRIITQGLSNLLEKEEALDICNTASSCQEALEVIEKQVPDVALIDLHLGDGNGLDLLRDISKSHPTVRSIILSSQDENAYAGRCIRAGAKGYVMKDKPFEMIVQAIKDVLAGNLFLSENIKQQLLQQSDFGGKSETTDIDLLSDREFEIFRFIGDGFRQRQIAEKLFISPITVNTHCKNIRSKLHLSSMNELVSRSIEWFQKK